MYIQASKKGAQLEVTGLVEVTLRNLESIYVTLLKLKCHQLQDVPLFYLSAKKEKTN